MFQNHGYGASCYSALEITTSQHMQRNKYSLKTNVFFYLKAEEAENFSALFSDM